MTPEELNAFAYPEGPVAPQIALDSAGQTIFAISTSGLTVMKLPAPADNIPVNSWALSRVTMNNHFEFSGGIASRLAAMRGKRSK